MILFISNNLNMNNDHPTGQHPPIIFYIFLNVQAASVQWCITILAHRYLPYRKQTTRWMPIIASIRIETLLENPDGLLMPSSQQTTSVAQPILDPPPEWLHAKTLWRREGNKKKLSSVPKTIGTPAVPNEKDYYWSGGKWRTILLLRT